MKKGEIEENNSIETRFYRIIDDKQVKKELKGLISSEKAMKEKELLDGMLRFLAEMPVNTHHDYRTFRHTGLREYLINRFLREKYMKS